MSSDKRSTVCLTFDFDAISLWIGTFKDIGSVSISRGEFGARVGIWRILKLLDKYDIKSTFFIPGHTADTYPEIIKNIHARGHEIAHHGYCHETVADLTYEEELEVLRRGIESLKTITGCNPLGYRAPDWKLSQNTIKLLIEHGFIYDSSMMADDYHPYRCRIGDVISKTKQFIFGEETNLLEVPVSWSLDDYPLFEEPKLSTPSQVFEIWRGDFDYMYENVENGIFNFTMHPQVIGRGHRMIMLEKFILYMRSYPNVCFMRIIDAVKT